MKIKFDTNAILSAPLESLNDISVSSRSQCVLKITRNQIILLPTRPGEERFTWQNINSPERNCEPNPVQASTSNLRNILFSL